MHTVITALRMYVINLYMLMQSEYADSLSSFDLFGHSILKYLLMHINRFFFFLFLLLCFFFRFYLFILINTMLPLLHSRWSNESMQLQCAKENKRMRWNEEKSVYIHSYIVYCVTWDLENDWTRAQHWQPWTFSWPRNFAVHTLTHIGEIARCD